MKYCEVKDDKINFKSLILKDNGVDVAYFNRLEDGTWGCEFNSGFYSTHILREVLLYFDTLEAEIP